MTFVVVAIANDMSVITLLTQITKNTINTSVGPSFVDTSLFNAL